MNCPQGSSISHNNGCMVLLSLTVDVLVKCTVDRLDVCIKRHICGSNHCSEPECMLLKYYYLWVWLLYQFCTERLLVTSFGGICVRQAWMNVKIVLSWWTPPASVVLKPTITQSRVCYQPVRGSAIGALQTCNYLLLLAVDPQPFTVLQWRRGRALSEWAGFFPAGKSCLAQENACMMSHQPHSVSGETALLQVENFYYTFVNNTCNIQRINKHRPKHRGIYTN